MNVYRIAALLLIGTSLPLAAMEWLSTDELESSCDAFLDGATGSDAALCLAFMQGFLAGADAAPVQNPAMPGAAPEDESFSERATRTRLSTLQLMQLRANQPAYCLDDALSAIDIVETVAGYLESHEEVLYLTNAEAVYAALVHEFPCES